MRYVVYRHCIAPRRKYRLIMSVLRYIYAIAIDI